MPTDASYTIADLARLTGLNVRTIRYWISQGLVPASGESGPGAHYGQGHLDRLQLIQRLQGEFLPNAEIRRRITPLSDSEVASLVGDGSEREAPEPATSALEYVRALLGESRSPTGGVRETAAPARLADATSTRPRSMPAVYSVGGPRTDPAALDRFAGDLADQVAADLQAGATGPAAAPTETTAAPAASATEEAGQPVPERSQWERLSLGPNIELHIRRPLSRIEQRRVERLITIARQVLGEDQS